MGCGALFREREREVEENQEAQRLVPERLDPGGYGAIVERVQSPLIARAPGWRTELQITSVENPSEPIHITPVDTDIRWYREFFHGKDHTHFLGSDAALGPCVVSLRRELQGADIVWRCIVRRRQGYTVRIVPERDVPAGFLATVPSSRAVLQRAAPDIAAALTEMPSRPALDDELLRLEERNFVATYKFGVLYMRPGQRTEEELLHNAGATLYTSGAYARFLELLGTRVALQGFEGYRGGLDVTSNATGTHSVYTRWRDFEIMFHVGTLLPYVPGDEQQLQRKRHIGNDISVIVFMDEEAGPFDPSVLVSNYNHVVMVVQPGPAGVSLDGTMLTVACAFKDGVPLDEVPPHLPAAPMLADERLRDLLLAKLVNAERASYRAPAFANPLQRTRTTLLGDLVRRFSL